MFDNTLNELGFISGILFIICGLSWILFEYFMAKYSDTQMEFKYPTAGFAAIKEVRHSQHINTSTIPKYTDTKIGTYRPPPIE